jgi:translocator protein
MPTFIDKDQLRQTLNAVFAPAMTITTLLTFYTGTSFDAATRSDVGRTLIEPAEYAFTIWIIIYGGALAYGIYQVMPTHRTDELLRRIGFFTASAFLATIMWLLMARFFSTWLTVICIIWMAISLTFVYLQIAKAAPTMTIAERYWVMLPLSIFSGWVTIAIFANTAAALKGSGLLNVGFSEEGWTILMLMIATRLSAIAIFTSRGNIAYTLTVIWGLAGIVVANLSRGSSLAVAATAALGIVCLLLTLRRSQ